MNTVRRVTAADAELLRDLRLRALRDAPLAFGSSYAREAERPMEAWERWAQEAAAGQRQVVFVAEPEAGLAMGFLSRDEPGVAHLFAMWVAPEARGSGAGRALVEAVAGWAAARGARRLRAGVTEGNAAAERLYAAAGFLDTGEREPLGHADATVAVLERALPASA